MAATKRKTVSGSGLNRGQPAQEVQEGELWEENQKASKFAEEAETDSDPIVESDTGV